MPIGAKQPFRSTKLVEDIDAMLDAAALRDGAVISFHHLTCATATGGEGRLAA